MKWWCLGERVGFYEFVELLVDTACLKEMLLEYFYLFSICVSSLVWARIFTRCTEKNRKPLHSTQNRNQWVVAVFHKYSFVANVKQTDIGPPLRPTTGKVDPSLKERNCTDLHLNFLWPLFPFCQKPVCTEFSSFPCLCSWNIGSYDKDQAEEFFTLHTFESNFIAVKPSGFFQL